ncbi:MAG: hypothetical protein RB191_18335 [Terriglobia bacterium]|nr:hypothetical protein [Terriglobia bacterium]
MKLSEAAVVNYEIVDSLIEEQFTSAEQEDIIKELQEKLESLGLDPAKAIIEQTKAELLDVEKAVNAHQAGTISSSVST